MADSSTGRRLELGRIGGVEVDAHWSVAVLLVLITSLLALNQLPAASPGHARGVYWAVGAGTALLFSFSLAAHEFAHALVARTYGVRVRRLTLWMLGGATELDSEPDSPRADARIAAAGPVATIVFGGVSLGVAVLAGNNVIGAGFAWLALMSFLLAVFNLLPGAPLDGGRLVRAGVWRHTGDRTGATIVAAQAGRVLGYLLVVLGFVAVFVGDVGGLWLALVGWFVIGGAKSERYAASAERLTGLTAGDVMSPVPLVAGRWWTAERLLREIDPRRAQPIFPLVDLDGHAAGAVALTDLERAVRAGCGSTRLDQLRPPYPDVPASAPLAAVLPVIRTRGHAAVVVDDQRRPIGVVDEPTLVGALHPARLEHTARRPMPLSKAGSP